MSLEGPTRDKHLSYRSLYYGPRPLEFDGYLDKLPEPEEIEILAKLLSDIRGTRLDIKNVGLDIDGVLAHPRQLMSQAMKDRLRRYLELGINLSLGSNNPSSMRRAEAEELGVSLVSPEEAKPSLDGFYRPLLEQNGWEGHETFFFGDTPATDKPYLASDFEIPEFEGFIDYLKLVLNQAPEAQKLWRNDRRAFLSFLKTMYFPPQPPVYNDQQSLADHHPNREAELFAGNFLLFPKAADYRSLIKQDIFRVLDLKTGPRLPKDTALTLLHKPGINSGLHQVIKRHPRLITSADIQAEVAKIAA